MLFSTISALAATLATAQAATIGFNYGSTFTDGSAKQQSDFEAEFNAAKRLAGTSGEFTSARLYTMIQGATADTPISAIPAAIDTQTTLLLGLWASAGQADMTNEITALKSAISQYGTQFTDLIVGISVGSEDLYRTSVIGIENHAGVGAYPATLVDYIGQVRSAIAGTAASGASVGHVDTWNDWVNGSNSAVIEACDWLGMDAYPYFENTIANGIDVGNATFYQAYDNTVGVARGKEVWVTETGWPVSGPQENQAVASIANAETYWKEVACSLFGKVNTWWYVLDDALPTTPSPSFGILTSITGSPLYDLTCDRSASASSSASSSLSASSSATKLSTSVTSASKPASSAGPNSESLSAAAPGPETAASTTSSAAGSSAVNSASSTYESVVSSSAAMSAGGASTYTTRLTTRITITTCPAECTATSASVATSFATSVSTGSSAASVTAGSSGAVSASASKASSAAPSPSASSSSCPTDLNGDYQYPHLIVPVDSTQPNTAYGTQYNGTVNSAISTIFNFDLPASYAGKTCSLIFLFPEQAALETSAYTFNGQGGMTVNALSSPATQDTSYNTVPSVSTKDIGTIPKLEAGNGYVITSMECPAAGARLGYEFVSTGRLALEFFEDWNPSPLGAFVRAC